MTPNGKPYDLDLTPLRTEELVVMAQCGYQAARDAIILRLYPWARERIAWWASQWKLGPEDAEDIQQIAVTDWLLEAICSYDTRQLARLEGEGCSFRTFLQTVLRRRFLDWVRNRGREEKYLDRGVQPFLEPQQPEDGGRNRAGVEFFSKEADPADAVADQEARERLRQAAAHLDPRHRQLWDLLMAGKDRPFILGEMGMSLGQLKRLRRAMLGQLVSHLHAVAV